MLLLYKQLNFEVNTTMLKFEIRNSIVDEEIVSEDDLELVCNFGVDTLKLREIEMQEKIKLK
jgi:hypothetical protein